MRSKKRLSKKCVIIAIAILANMLPQMVLVHAEPEEATVPVVNTEGAVNVATESNQEVSNVEFLARAAGVYETLSGPDCIFKDFDKASTDDYLINAIALGLASISDIQGDSKAITREDAMNILYRAIVSFDSDFVLDESEADYILNSCYDNAELKSENRIGYAFMIKHGLITDLTDTNPTEKLLKSEVDKLFADTISVFSQNVSIIVGDNTLYVGESEKELVATFGEPDRTDKSEYGFDWYVYNSDYAKYITIGIRNGRVCAFFTNAEELIFDKTPIGGRIDDEAAYEEVVGLKFYKNDDGGLSGVSYNKYESLTDLTVDEYMAVGESKKLELYDVICADRAKRELPEIVLTNKLEKSSTNIDVSGDDILDLYEEMNKYNFTEMTSDHDYAIAISISVDDGEMGFDTRIGDVTDDMATVNTTSKYVVYDYTVDKPTDISAPSISIDQSTDIKINGQDVILNLKKSTSNKYLITIFDSEKDAYIVNQIITTGDDKLIYPSSLFTGGSTYTVNISAFDDSARVDKKQEYFKGNNVVFDYGTPENPVKLVTPYNEGSTYDDELEVTIDSSVYHDFLIQVTDAKGKEVASKRLTDESFAVLDALPAGRYTVKATAYKRGTDTETGTDSVTCTIDSYTPEIEEFLLAENDPYTYVYFTPDLKFLYTYKEETVNKDVTSSKEVTYLEDETTIETIEQEEEYIDENGETKTRIVTVEQPVTKQVEKIRTEQTTTSKTYRKIIRTKVPVTKKTLREANYSIEEWSNMANGSASDFGNAFSVLALSYQGVNYVWGGTTPNGFDCSGLVTYCAAQLGLKTHRVAEEQYLYDGIPVSRDSMVPGDLVFFKDSTGYIHHVGIYIGNGMMVHAPHTGDVVRVASLSSSYYQKEFAGAKRLVPQVTN